jgi:hypothetical protein
LESYDYEKIENQLAIINFDEKKNPPTIRIEKGEFSATKSTYIMTSLDSYRISPIVFDESINLDGVQFKLSIGRKGSSWTELYWQNSLPHEWKELTELVELLEEKRSS